MQQRSKPYYRLSSLIDTRFDEIPEAEIEAARQITHGHVPTAYDQTQPKQSRD